LISETVFLSDGQETEEWKKFIIVFTNYNGQANQNIFITSFTEQDIQHNDYDKAIIKNL